MAAPPTGPLPLMVLAVFVDGLGLGRPDTEDNPVLDSKLEVLPWLLAGAVPLDATLKVPGLPQSATGQATLFTGVNAAAVAGRHVQGFPGPSLRRLLGRGTFYSRVTSAGGKAAFLNTYSRAYLRMMAAGHMRASCSTLAAVSAGLPLRDAASLRRGDGVHHDLTGDALCAQGEDVPRLDARGAAETALRVAARHDLTVLEYFLTDQAGHSGDRGRARDVLRRLDAFLAAVLDGLGLGGGRQAAYAGGPPGVSPVRLVLFSDHGNIEDMSCDTHTLNPVPLVVWPPHEAARSCTDLTGVAGLLEALAAPG